MDNSTSFSVIFLEIDCEQSLTLRSPRVASPRDHARVRVYFVRPTIAIAYLVASVSVRFSGRSRHFSFLAARKLGRAQKSLAPPAVMANDIYPYIHDHMHGIHRVMCRNIIPWPEKHLGK